MKLYDKYHVMIDELMWMHHLSNMPKQISFIARIYHSSDDSDLEYRIIEGVENYLFQFYGGAIKKFKIKSFSFVG